MVHRDRYFCILADWLQMKDLYGVDDGFRTNASGSSPRCTHHKLHIMFFKTAYR